MGQLTTMQLSQLLTQRMQRSSVAHDKHMPVWGRQRRPHKSAIFSRNRVFQVHLANITAAGGGYQ